jgi:hypothetical protein
VDVKGFFDNINHERLTSIIYHMGFPEQIVRWVASFLQGRSACCRIGSFTGPILPINVGVPQGFPCSPILSVIYSSPILESLASDPWYTASGYPIVPRSYIDDFSFLAISHSASINTEALTHTLHRIVSLLGKSGMSIDPDKSELIHFSRSHVLASPHLIQFPSSHRPTHSLSHPSQWSAG